MPGLRRHDEDHRRTDRASGHSHHPRRGRPGVTRSARSASTPPPSDRIRLRWADPATPSFNALSPSGDDCVPTSREVQLDHTSKARDRSQNLPRCCGPCVSNAKPLANPLPNPPTRPNPHQKTRQIKPKLLFIRHTHLYSSKAGMNNDSKSENSYDRFAVYANVLQMQTPF